MAWKSPGGEAFTFLATIQCSSPVRFHKTSLGWQDHAQPHGRALVLGVWREMNVSHFSNCLFPVTTSKLSPEHLAQTCVVLSQRICHLTSYYKWQTQWPTQLKKKMEQQQWHISSEKLVYHALSAKEVSSWFKILSFPWVKYSLIWERKNERIHWQDVSQPRNQPMNQINTLLLALKRNWSWKPPPPCTHSQTEGHPFYMCLAGGPVMMCG